MSETAGNYANLEPKLKEEAKEVLDRLGIPLNIAINMFLRQIVMRDGIPFDVTLPCERPFGFDPVTREELHAEIIKGMEDIEAGRVVSMEEINREMEEWENNEMESQYVGRREA
ncbi:MAG: type II toxin-antitoxin system RelB/DinJ family antitoxin [Defluviitaleaceae bacterium]|nr:type II toxin-antitoxin system RelB/DinJ family antitoxin [Defluviitaleaceae bacterium]